MNQIAAETLGEIFETAGLSVGADVSVRSYSGRGMYGEECFGFVTDSNSALHVFLTAAGIVGAEHDLDHRGPFGAEDAFDLARSVDTDTMGHGQIIYFPGWELTGWTEDENDDQNEEI